MQSRELDDETYVIVDENINLAEKNCGIEIYIQCLDAQYFHMKEKWCAMIENENIF
jgi:hypothetical protein